MSSIASDPGGRKRIQFVDPNGDRKAVRLGKVSQRAAESFKIRVEALLEVAILKQPMSADLAGWVAGLDATMAEKLAKVGLIAAPADKDVLLLGAFLESYFAKRGDVKASTQTNWGHTRRLLLEYFGADRPLKDITAGDAKDWERWLRTPAARENRYGENKADDGLATNTIRKRVSNAKQFFQDAMNRELLTRNPFAKLNGAVGSNRHRDYFLTREDTAKLLAACPDQDWRLIIALSRYGGLRCPSEHLALKWSDINWERSTMIVHSPKTEHHEGKDSRLVPIFPELRVVLDASWDAAEPGAEYIINRYRDAAQNLRTTFQKIIKRAGLTPWPKLFQNLRSSRATELAAEYPAHVAAAWLGHSTIVANKHYWQVTDDDIAKATTPKPAEPKAAQKAAQQAHASSGFESQASPPAHEKTPVLPGFTGPCDLVQICPVGGTGLEPVTSTV